MQNKLWRKLSAGFLAVTLATSMLPATALASEVPVESEAEEAAAEEETGEPDAGAAEETGTEAAEAKEAGTEAAEAEEAADETADGSEAEVEDEAAVNEAEAETEAAEDAAEEEIIAAENSADVLMDGEEEYSISLSCEDRMMGDDEEGYYTWGFTGEQLTLGLDTTDLSGLTEDYTVSYDVGNWDDIDQVWEWHSFGSGIYTVSDDSESITLDISAVNAAMAETIESFTETTPMDTNGFQVRAYVTKEGESDPFAQTNLYVVYAEPYYDFETWGEFSDGEYLAGWGGELFLCL
ncbi:MAG: hypothetical protein LIO96_00775 [Lachnospiraceae bacterium]|nr:hypothetical protein [Lachnospiraceae bacterium]